MPQGRKKTELPKMPTAKRIVVAGIPGNNMPINLKLQNGILLMVRSKSSYHHQFRLESWKPPMIKTTGKTHHPKLMVVLPWDFGPTINGSVSPEKIRHPWSFKVRVRQQVLEEHDDFEDCVALPSSKHTNKRKYGPWKLTWLNGKSQCPIGNTSSFMVDFPLPY